ncbi:MAG: hypothetical protein Q9182_004819 [Xanthomendoza sp. 2 TL-2023]
MALPDPLAFQRLRLSPPVSGSAPATVDPPSHTKGKRSQSTEPEFDMLEDIWPSKQIKILAPFQRWNIDDMVILTPPLPLSEENLAKFDAESIHSRNAVSSVKRKLPRNSNQSGRSQDTTRTKGVSVASATYRYECLADAQLFFHLDPPDYIDASIKAIVDAELTDGDQAKLKDIASQFHIGIMKVVKATVGEGGFLEIFTDAFKAMNTIHLCHRVRSDWREELKPSTRPRDFNLDFLAISNLETNRQLSDSNEALLPRKRQQRSADQKFMSSSSTIDVLDFAPTKKTQEPAPMLSPIAFSLPLKGDRSVIKTPRPDLTIGILSSTLVSRLSTNAFNEVDVEKFLRDLQDQMKPREAGKPTEPILITVPAPCASDLTFPFLVIEGKAYSTGKQMFEAENQAAVSGACGLKVQLCLDDLVRKVNRSATSANISPSSSTSPPLFFSVCTEGPIHALWAHYTLIENGVRKYQMTLLKCCNAVKLKDAEEFLFAFYNICNWGAGGFLDSVVERLAKVVNAATLISASWSSGPGL